MAGEKRTWQKDKFKYAIIAIGGYNVKHSLAHFNYTVSIIPAKQLKIDHLMPNIACTDLQVHNIII